MQFNKLPEDYSDSWNKLKDHVSNQFDRTFNNIKLENLQAVLGDSWFEAIQTHEVTDKELNDNGYHIADMNESEIDDAKQEIQNSNEEIIWSTLFEASSEHIADKIREHRDEIHDLGLVIIETDHEAYETGVFLGVGSAGHDFYTSYWVQLWNIFEWLPEMEVEK